jgi:hypothetical protein
MTTAGAVPATIGVATRSAAAWAGVAALDGMVGGTADMAEWSGAPVDVRESAGRVAAAQAVTPVAEGQAAAVDRAEVTPAAAMEAVVATAGVVATEVAVTGVAAGTEVVATEVTARES